ncbi:uncharacterized protein LOC131663013 [Phymastichus coffea]|uniref:uncharacterized protein LOC131663013 n=1 Tax=Phymastichus coffea TaxID=108790 RepID=UPI00273CC43D|nr:uncharacterized protein LOC131663013 [Phymastichus coffea]
MPDQSDYTNAKLVFFDLETTDLDNNHPEMTQIAACSKDEIYSAYVIPSRGVPKRINDITGFQVIGDEMFYDDTLLKTVSLRVAFEDFLTFLHQQDNNVILVAHNEYRLEFPLLLRTLSRLHLLEQFKTIVSGFRDTLNIFHKVFPARKKEKKSFSQTFLATDYLGSESVEGVDNALTDINTLQKLIAKIKIDNSIIINLTQSIFDFLRSEALKTTHSTNKISLEYLKDCISSNMLSRIAKAGINRNILIDVYKAKGPKGIEVLLGEGVRGRPRLTKHKSVLPR